MTHAGHDDERHVAQHHLLLGVGITRERAEQRQQQQRHDSRERGVRQVEHDEVVHEPGDEEAATHEETADGRSEARAFEVLHAPRDHHRPCEGENADRKRVLEVALLLGFAAYLRGVILDHRHLAPARAVRFQLPEFHLRDDGRKDLRVERPPEDAVAVNGAEDELDQDGTDENSGPKGGLGHAGSRLLGKRDEARGGDKGKGRLAGNARPDMEVRRRAHQRASIGSLRPFAFATSIAFA